MLSSRGPCFKIPLFLECFFREVCRVSVMHSMHGLVLAGRETEKILKELQK